MELITKNAALEKFLTQYIRLRDRKLINILQHGLPLTERPFAALAQQTGLCEKTVIERIRQLLDRNVIKRFGVIVRHHELGYKDNAMVVWDVPDNEIKNIAALMIREPFITLCYRRPRRPPAWPYNLFCMIHGKDRSSVLEQLEAMIGKYNWQHYPYDILFSKRRFKQRGAYYVTRSDRNDSNPAAVTQTDSIRDGCVG